VRGQQQVGAARQRRARRQRLLLEHVHGRRAERAGGQRPRQRTLVDDAAARRVHQDGARLHQCQPPRVDQVGIAPRERHVQAHDVGVAEQRVQVGIRDGVVPGRMPGRQRGVVRDHAHAHRARQPADRLADGAEADQPQGLAAGFAPVGERLARPLPLGHAARSERETAQQHHRHAHHVHGHRQRMGAHRRHHRDVTVRAVVLVDVVEAGAEPADGDDPWRRRQQLAVDSGAVVHDQRIGVAQGRRQRGALGAQLGRVQHVEARAQGFHGRLVHGFGDDDALARRWRVVAHSVRWRDAPS